MMVPQFLLKMPQNDINMKFHQTNRRGLCCTIPAVIKHSKAKYQSKYDASFHITSDMWNLLPAEIKNGPSFISFKTALSAYINQFSDLPPVPGYPCENSLLTILMLKWRNPAEFGGPTSSEVNPAGVQEEWMASISS